MKAAAPETPRIISHIKVPSFPNIGALAGKAIERPAIEVTQEVTVAIIGACNVESFDVA